MTLGDAEDLSCFSVILKTNEDIHQSYDEHSSVCEPTIAESYVRTLAVLVVRGDSPSFDCESIHQHQGVRPQLESEVLWLDF